MSQVAGDAGLSRESLYRALSADGNPPLRTVSVTIPDTAVTITGMRSEAA